eukprot:SAG22_NODE_2568_length_2433_cov_2.143959_2_plen_321_part_00
MMFAVVHCVWYCWYDVEQYHTQCTTANIMTCVPACNATHRGFELLATFDGTDTKFSCNLANQQYSWVGAAALGGFLGENVDAFISAVISGAAGTYENVLTLTEDADIGTDLVVRPGQYVVISGDAGLAEVPSWGRGGFTVGERGSLSLLRVGIDGAITSAPGAMPLTLSDCILMGSDVNIVGSLGAWHTCLGGSTRDTRTGHVSCDFQSELFLLAAEAPGIFFSDDAVGVQRYVNICATRGLGTIIASSADDAPCDQFECIKLESWRVGELSSQIGWDNVVTLAPDMRMPGLNYMYQSTNDASDVSGWDAQLRAVCGLLY